MSGVAITVSKSMKPSSIRLRRSASPTTSAPASWASRCFSPLANTATRTVLPMPLGSTTAPRTIWSACFGSTPRLMATSTVWSNFTPRLATVSLRSLKASSTP
jgi:hypothetical protein